MTPRPQPHPFIIYDDELLNIKMLTEDCDDHSIEISRIVQDCLSRPAKESSDKEVQVGIHCPLCGFHQTVPEEEWNFQHLHGHGHTCASDKCPSHTYLVLDGDIDNTSDKVLEKIVSDFILKNEIGCPETIYQCDHVIEEACEFIESLCNVVGYFDYDTKELRQKERP